MSGLQGSVPVRLTVVMSHPVQYMTPLLQRLAQLPQLELIVVYLTRPTPAQQGSGFGIPFTWDEPLLDGYTWRLSRAALPGDDYGRFTGIDDPGLPGLVLDTSPDVVLVSGWQFAGLLRATLACRCAGVPVLYRGDTHLGQGPAGGLRRWAWERRTRSLLSWFDGFLAVGSRSRELLQCFGVPAARIFPSPHCVDTVRLSTQALQLRRPEERRRLRAAFGLPEEGLVVLFAGKLDENKRPLDLVRAAQGDPASTLLFAGAGPLLETCRREAYSSSVFAGFPGFLNQTRMSEAYAAADLLVLPSQRESWGLVVNEAMASGVPCVVSDGVGCAPDLIVPGATGETFRVGDVAGLRAAMGRIAAAYAAGQDFGPACRTVSEAHSAHAAATGVLRAAQSFGTARKGGPPRDPPRVLAELSDFVVMGGLERMSFQVLEALIGCGAKVHCVTNDWEYRATADAAGRVGASWSRGTPYFDLSRRSSAGVAPILRAGVGVARDSWRLGRDLRRTGATHVFLPTHMAGLRCGPGLLLARALGVRTVLRLGTATGPGRLQAAIWRWAVNPLVDDYVCNSRFTLETLLATGVTPRKAQVIYNALALPGEATVVDGSPLSSRVVYVGQVIPAKGLLELLEAIALTIPRVPDVQLDVVGRVTGWEAPCHAGYFQAVQQRAQAQDLQGRVRFHGWLDDVSSVLEGAGLHCCPSRREIREGFGIVCLEAKSAGVPSVVTPSGALPEVVRHEVDGWVCDDDTPAAIAEGIETLLLLPPGQRRRLSAAARADLVRRFSLPRFRAEWSRVFLREERPLPLRGVPGWALPLLALAHPAGEDSWT